MILIKILAVIGSLFISAFWGVILAVIDTALQNKDKRGE